MNAIKRTYIKLKKKALRLYDWHYMIRVYANRDSWGDPGLPFILGDLIWFLFFANLVNPFLLGVQKIPLNAFWYEYTFCVLLALISIGVFNYKIYTKGKREDMLDKVWHKKSRITNKLILVLEVFTLVILGWAICFILCAQYTYK